MAQLYNQGKGQEFLTYELLNSWSEKVMGAHLPMSRERVDLAKDYRIDTERNNCIGGPSQKEIKRMLGQQHQKALALSKSIDDLKAKWQAADRELHRRIEALSH